MSEPARSWGNDPSILAELALVEHDAGDEDAALAMADRAIDGGSCFVPMLAMRAEILAARHRGEEAAEAFLSAYLAQPHAWRCLERYCALKGISYTSPMDEAPAPASPLARQWLYAFIDTMAHTPDEDGAIPGCDHTLGLSQAWAERAGVDPIALCQFLNARGGFCDCEVVFNAEPTDSAFGRLAIASGVVGEGVALHRALLDAGLARVGPPPIGREADEEEGEAPLALAALTDASGLLLPPQLAAGRQLGQLVWAALDTLPASALFWAVVVAVDDDRTSWFWTSQGGTYRCERFDEASWDVDGLEEVAREALDMLYAALPEAPATVWVEPLALPPPTPDAPRLLYHGEDFVVRAATGDGRLSIKANLAGAFQLIPSPGGSRFAYVEIGRAGECLVLGDVATGERRRVMRAQHFDECKSWLDERTLYVTTEQGGHLVGVDGSVRGGLPERGRLSRDGALLAWEDDRGIVVQDLDGQEHHRLPRPGNVWDVSPAGDALVFTAVEGSGHRVYLWRFAEAEARPLTSPSSSCYWPAFLADGSAIVCDRDARHILRVDLAGREPEVISEGTSSSRPVVHPTRLWIAWQARGEEGERVVTRSPSGVIAVLPGRGSESVWWPI